VAGVGFAVRDTTRNLGPADAPASTTAFFLSGNTAWSPDDTLLASRPAPALDSGADHAATTTVTLPDATPAGRYFVLAVADATAGIAEANESNNVAARPVLVGPDLQVAALTAPPGIAAGGTAAVTVTVVNRGAGMAAASQTRLHLGGSSKVLGALMGTLAVPALPAGAAFTGSITMTVPAGTPAGSTKLWAVADADQRVAESRETNNSRAAAITIF
jgi:subtilase family serine protease